MIREDFLEFVKTGELINFPFGSTKSSVQELLGDVNIEFDSVQSSMIRYDRTEFYFYHAGLDTGRLYGVVILPFSIADEGNLDMKYNWLTEKLSYKQTKALLILDKIDFEETTSEYNAEDKVLKTSSEVIFFFFQENKKINKVGRYISLKDLEKYIV